MKKTCTSNNEIVVTIDGLSLEEACEKHSMEECTATNCPMCSYISNRKIQETINKLNERK